VSSRTKRISSRISKLLSKRRNGGGGSESSISLPTLTLSSGQIVYPRLGLSPEEISSIHTKKLKASHFSVSPVELLQQQQQQQGKGEGQQVQIGIDVTHASSSTNSLLSFSKNAIQTAMTELQYVKLEQEKNRRRELRSTASTGACASSSINDSSSSSPPLSSNIWNNSIAIVVDCNGDNYGALMTRSESSSLSLQLAHCYAAIKRANEAFAHASYSSSLVLGLVGLTSDRVRDLKKISGVERWKNVFSSISSLEEVFHLNKVKQSNSSSEAAAIKGGEANTGVNSFTGTSLSTNSLPSTTICSSSIIVDGYITSSSSSSLPISNDSHNSQRMESSIESQTINLGIGSVPPPPSPNPPRQIYYLTSDATEILWRPRPNATYIVGGIVDRNRFPQLALNRAKEIGVKTVRFPLEESLADLGHMHRHRILTTNKAVELLVEVVISSSGVQRKKRFIISNVDIDHNVHKEPDQEQQQKESHLVNESVCRDVDHTMSIIAFEEEKEKKKKRGILIENDGNDDDDDDSDIDDHDDNDDDVESESFKVIWKKAIDKILLQRPLLQPLSRQEGEGGEALDE
jgi:hypothetical protein